MNKTHGILLMTLFFLLASFAFAAGNGEMVRTPESRLSEPVSVDGPSVFMQRYNTDNLDELDEIIYFQDFEDGLPEDWTIVDVDGGGTTWYLETILGLDDLVPDFMIIDADDAGPGTVDYLITPEINCTDYTGIELSFDTYFEVFIEEYGYLEISTDGGANWTTIHTFSDTEGDYPFTMDISEWADGQATVQFRFHYDDSLGNWGYYWGIDNLVVSGDFGGELIPPSFLTADRTDDEVDLSWLRVGRGAGFFEDFTDGVADGFTLEPDNSFEIADDYLVGTGPGADNWFSAYYSDSEYDDVLFEVEVSKTVGSTTASVGILLRGNGAMGGDYFGYLFNITASGSYSIFAIEGQGATEIQAWTTSQAINTGLGSWNTVAVNAVGNEFTFFINGEDVFAFTDDTFDSGYAGVGAFDSDGGDTVQWNTIGASTDFELLAQYASPNPHPIVTSPVDLAEMTVSPLPEINNPRHSGEPFIRQQGALLSQRLGQPVNELDEFIEYIVYRDDAEIGRTEDYNYTDILPAYGEYTYYVTALYDEGESDPSNEVMVNWPDPNNAPDVLIWDPDMTPGSAEEIQGVLEELGLTTAYTVTISDEDLGIYDYVFCFLGMYPNNFTIGTNSPEEGALIDYLDAGGNLYLEGGDAFGFNPPTNLLPYFNLTGVDDGTDDLTTVEGVDGEFTEGLSMAYTGENSWIDHIQPANGDATLILVNPADGAGCGVLNDEDGYHTAAISFEAGLLTDDVAPSTREYLMQGIMSFFGWVGEFGDIEGTVTECTEDGDPLEGVEVYLDGQPVASTDDEGMYVISDVLIGTYTLSFELEGHITVEVENVEVLLDQVTTVDAVMTYPDGQAATDPIEMTVTIGVEGDSTATATIDLSNLGCGPLEWETELNVLEAPWGDDPSNWLYVETDAGILDPEETTTITIVADITADYLGEVVDVSDGDLGMGELYLQGAFWGGIGPIDIVVDFYDPTAVADNAGELPREYALHQNFPNPFNPTTSIRFDLVQPQTVKLAVYNLLGQQVAVLVDNERLEAGYHMRNFDGSSLASGLYFYRIETEAFTGMKKMILVK